MVCCRTGGRFRNSQETRSLDTFNLIHSKRMFSFVRSFVRKKHNTPAFRSCLDPALDKRMPGAVKSTEEEPAPVSVRGHVRRGVISVQFNITSDLTAGTENTGIKEQWGREVMDATMGRYKRPTFQPVWGVVIE